MWRTCGVRLRSRTKSTTQLLTKPVIESELISIIASGHARMLPVCARPSSVLRRNRVSTPHIREKLTKRISSHEFMITMRCGRGSRVSNVPLVATRINAACITVFNVDAKIPNRSGTMHVTRPKERSKARDPRPLRIPKMPCLTNTQSGAERLCKFR